jgi:hypothetical protein
MRWVYVQSERYLWTVGFYDPKNGWHSDSDHATKESAAKRVHWLNGGNTDNDGGETSIGGDRRDCDEGNHPQVAE